MYVAVAVGGVGETVKPARRGYAKERGTEQRGADQRGASARGRRRLGARWRLLALSIALGRIEGERDRSAGTHGVVRGGRAARAKWLGSS